MNGLNATIAEATAITKSAWGGATKMGNTRRNEDRAGEVDYILMPILKRHYDAGHFPSAVLIPLDRERQALRNHGQTLARLKERGGLAPSEAVAIMLRKEYKKLPPDHLNDYFVRFGWGIVE